MANINKLSSHLSGHTAHKVNNMGAQKDETNTRRLLSFALFIGRMRGSKMTARVGTPMTTRINQFFAPLACQFVCPVVIVFEVLKVDQLAVRPGG